MDSKRARGLRPRGWWLAAAVLAAVVLASVASAGAQEVLTISGRVVGPDGVTGVPDVTVSALTTFWYEVKATATTGVDGSYTITGLDPALGGLIVTFDPSASNTAHDTDYLAEMYDDAPYPMAATTVPPGTGGVNAQLAVGGSVSGTVYDDDGVTGIEGIPVTAGTAAIGVGSPSAITGPGGSYTIRGVPAGDAYVSTVVTEYNELNDTDYLNASVTVPVAQGVETPGADLTLGAGGRIQGTVTGGGGPLAGVAVSAQNPTVWTNPTYSDYTGTDGAYVLRGVEPGVNYKVQFSTTEFNAANDAGFASESYSDSHSDSFTPVNVSVGSATAGISATLEEGGTVSGIVYLPDGITPAEGIRVYDPYRQVVFDYTDVDGAYTLRGGYATGAAYVAFNPAEYNTANGTAYLAQYYDGKTTSWDSDPVPVTLGEDTPGINAVLYETPPGPGSITGRVLGPDEVNPIAGIKVLVDGPTPAYAYTDFEGLFTLPGLTAGDYTVTVDPTDYNSLHSPALEGQTLPAPIGVLDDRVSTVADLALGASGHIAGHVYATDGVTPLEGISVQGLDSMGMPLTDTTTDANGFYLLPASGTTLVWYSPYDYNITNGTAFVAEYYDNVQYSYIADAVSPGSIGIDAALAQSGSISGTVYAADGVTPLEGIDVWAGWITYDTTDENGEYTITGLAPGTYGVRFNPDAYNTTHTPVLEEWYKDTYSNMTVTSVRVTEGQDTPEIDATLDVASIITGSVTAIDQPAGLSGVDVYVNSTGSLSWSDVFTTGAGGVYTAYVPQGTYSVSFSPYNYNQMNGTAYVGESWQDVHSGAATPVVVGAGATVPDIDAELEIGGTITGAVTGPDGLGITGVQVTAYPAGGPPMGVTAYTTTGGAYNLRGLNAGDYTVSFDPSSYNMMNDQHLLSEYYLDARDSADAQAVPVALGEETPLINAQLELSGSISGTVYAADGITPLSGVLVVAMGDGFSSTSSATSGADGTYTVWGLIDGNYRVQFDPSPHNDTNDADYIGEYYNAQADYELAALVPVTISDDTGLIDATLEMGGAISGTVYGSDGQPAADVSVQAEGGGSSGSANSGEDGTYVIHGLAPGTYAVRFDPMMHNWYYDDGLLSEYFDGAPEWQLAAPVDVLVGEDTGSINATLRQGAMITGTVYGPDGTTPAPYVSVYTSPGTTLGDATTGADGTYTIKGVPAGTYSVRFDPWNHNDMYGARLLSEYYENTRDESAATTRWLEPGETWSGVDATLEEGATLSGTVTGDDGAKLGGITVRLTDPVTGVEIWRGTDASGFWTADAVPPGSYILEFDPSNYNDAYDASYVREFWSDKAGFWEADPVSVSLAETRSGLDTQLVQGGLALTANIGGLPAGAGDSYQWVDLYERLADGRERYLTSIETLSVPEGETNSIQFRGLTPGDYLLRAEVNGETWGGVWAYDQQPTAPQYYGTTPVADQYRMAFADVISMTTADRTVTMNAPGFGTISGSVTDPDGAPLSEIRVDFMREAPDGTWVPVEWAWTLSDGTFECQLVPGDYKVFYSDEWNTWFAQSVWHLDAPGETEARTITLAPGGTVGLETQVMQIGGGPGLMTNVEADPAMPDGNFGWYKTAPTVTLTCTDPSATIWYYWGADAPAEYTDPLTAPEGTSSLTAYAEDTLGNLEPEHTWDFNVDTEAPDVPTGLMATPMSESSIALNWDTGFDTTSGIDYYRIYQDGVPVFMWSGTDHTVFDLEADTTYGFTLTAVDWAGNESAPSAPVEATTFGGADTTPPTTTLDADPAAPDGADGWYVTRPVITLTADEPATIYYSWDGVTVEEYSGPINPPLGINTLEFAATDLIGNPEASQFQEFKYDDVQPTAPTGFSGTQIDTAGNVTVSWSTSTDEHSGVYRYVILELNGAIWVPLADFAPEAGPTQTESLGVLGEGGHTLCVVAVDTAGNYSANSDADYVSVDTSPPTTLIWLGGGTTGSAGWYTMSPTITLDSAEPGCTTYYHWGTDTPSEYAGPFTAPEGVNTLSFWSVDAIGNTEAPAKTREFTVDSVAPAAPALVTATAAGENAIDVSWSAVTDDMDGGADASGITLYGVYVDGMWLADTSDTSYQVTGLDQNTTYEIAITALDVAGNEGPSASDTATTDADLTAPTTAIDLADGIEGENGWYIAPPTITLTPSEDGTTWYQWGTDDPAVYSDPLIAPDGVNTVTFWSQDVYGNTETPPQTATFSVDGVAPATPTGLSATSVGLDTVDLAWDAVTLDDLGSPDISGIALYRVYGGPEIFETTETSFQVPGLDQGSGYSFLVTAVDTAGNEGIGADLPVTTEHETTPPTTALTLTGGTAGLNGWYTAAPSITLTPDEDGTTWYQWDTDATETGYAGSFLAITGEHTLSYYSVDVWGNTEDPQTATLKLDTSAPATPTGLTAEQTAPGTVTISWNAASDSESGMYTHALIQSGPQNMGWSVPGATYTATGLAAGTYTYTIEAINNAGLRSATSAAVEVTVDNTAPSTEVSVDPAAPGGANGWYTAAPAITLTADESGTTWYAWDAGTPTEYTGAFSPSVGEHTLTYWSVDAVGNTEDEHQAGFKLDTSTPLAPLGVTASQTAPSIVNITWGAGVDTQSGVDHYVLCEWNGSAWVAIDSAIPSTSSSYQLSSVSGGAHRYCIRSVNGAGVTSTESNAADVTVDNTAPATTLAVDPTTADGANGWYDSVPTITLTADDAAAVTWYRWGANAPVEYDAPFSPPQGSNTLSYWSVDVIGNTETPAKTAAFKIDTVAPAAPTGLTALDTQQTSIDIGWNAVTDDADGGADSSGIATYRVYVDGAPFGETVGTSLLINGLTQNTSYSISVRATDAAGNEGAAATQSFRTTADVTAPKTTLSLTGGTSGANGWYTSWPTITLTVDESADTYVQWDGGATVPYTGGFTYSDGEHTLTYWSVDGASNVEDPKPTQVFKVDTVAPRVPDAPSFTAGETTVDLAWTAVTDDADGGADSSGIAAYRVYQGATKIAEVAAPATAYQVTGLTASTSYSFTIAAVDTAGNEGAQSSAGSGSTAADTTPPAAPAGLTAVAGGQTSIVLSWNAATDPSGIAKYTVYRADGTKVADVTAPATAYTVTGLSAGTSYSYYVKAVDTAGNTSAASTTATAKTHAVPAVTLSPVYRFYNFTNGTHFYTASADERDMVIARWSNVFSFEGVVYNTNPANNTQPLYRFYNKKNGSHFYTASPDEAAMVLAKWPSIFSLDGQTYAVNPGPVPNSIPVYRFYNKKNGSHFFTASADERDTVIARWSNVYDYEGPAFWLGQ